MHHEPGVEVSMPEEARRTRRLTEAQRSDVPTELQLPVPGSALSPDQGLLKQLHLVLALHGVFGRQLDENLLGRLRLEVRAAYV